MKTNDFIKELRKVSTRFSEYNDENDSVNGFRLDGKGVGEYGQHLDILYMDYFDQINDHVDNLLLNNSIQSILNFLDSKIKRLEEVYAPITELDKELDRVISLLENNLSDAIKYKYVFCDNCNGPDDCPACQESLVKQTKTIRIKKLNQDFLDFKIGIPTYHSSLEKENELDSRYYSHVMEHIGREYIKKSFDRLYGLYNQYSTNKIEETKKVWSDVQIDRDFRAYLHHENKDALIQKLHELLDGKKGKLVVTVIKALENLRFIAGYENRSELYKVMRHEFGDNIGSNSGLNDFFNKSYKILDGEIEHYIDIFKSIK